MSVSGGGDGSMGQDLRRLTEAFITFSTRVETQYQMILDKLRDLDTRFCDIERDNGKHAHSIEAATRRLTSVETSVEKMEIQMQEMQPWVSGLRWALTIAGGVLVLAVVGGVFWAIVQSGVRP